MKVQGLKPKQRAKALDNMLDYWGDDITLREALEKKLVAAFPWNAAREGENYWMEIYNKNK